jgi:hypothetical protein
VNDKTPGLSWDDVDLLHWMASFAEGACYTTAYSREKANEVRRIARKLAASLPPRTGGVTPQPRSTR